MAPGYTAHISLGYLEEMQNLISTPITAECPEVPNKKMHFHKILQWSECALKLRMLNKPLHNMFCKGLDKPRRKLVMLTSWLLKSKAIKQFTRMPLRIYKHNENT